MTVGSNKYEALPGYHSDDESIACNDSIHRKWQPLNTIKDFFRESSHSSNDINTKLEKKILGSLEKKPRPSPSLDLDFHRSDVDNEKNKLYHKYLKNIETLSREILVSEDRLRTELRQGVDPFSLYIDSQIKKFASILKSARTEYAHIMSNYFETPSQVLLPLDSSRVNPFAETYTKGLLMKIVKKSLLALSKENLEKSGVVISVNYLDNKKIKFLANWGKVSRLRIVRWSGMVLPKDSNIFIARGGFGVVQRVFDISIGKIAALKFAKGKSQTESESCMEDCQNEIEKLKVFNSNSSVDGIQNAPWAHYDFYYKNKRFVGFLQKLYSEGDLFGLIFEKKSFLFTKKKILRMIQQLFIGLREIHKKKIIHGDIKLENILIDFNGENYDAYLGDFGGAKSLGSEVSIHNKNGMSNQSSGFATVVTIDYYTFGDYQESIQAINQRKEKQWFELLKKRDIYALATVAWAIITFDLPYFCMEGQRFPDTTAIMSYDTARTRVGLKLTSVLSKALSENPNDRPTIEEILNQIDIKITPMSK